MPQLRRPYWVWPLTVLIIGLFAGLIIGRISNSSTANDGRLNPDGAATAVVYCDGGMSVWPIDNGQGTWAFTASMQQVSNALTRAYNSDAHQMVAQGGGATLYALKYADNPQLQLQRGTYNFVFSTSACGALPAATVAQQQTTTQQQAPAQDQPDSNAQADTTTQQNETNPDANRCDPGNVWGDGRCNNDDPNVKAYNWTVGWYYQRVDDGIMNVQDIPEQYRQYGLEPPTDEVIPGPITPDPGSPDPGEPAPGSPDPDPGGATCFTSPPIDITPHLPDISGMGDADGLLALVNAARSYCGRGTLGLNGQLNTAAQWHSDDMVARGYFSHTAPAPAPYGVQPWDRAATAGYPGGFIGENIASGYGSVYSAFLGWWNSDGHRENILRNGFNNMGFGRNGSMMTQLFGG
jgi:uncharacterized protein YkwD